MASNFWVVQATDYQALCPIGAPGELLIEGPLLARGYLNDKAKTAASFVVDPQFIAQLGLRMTGRRMYRTGDLVRQNPDGSLLYLGRCNSQQVKIRGQRVDVGDIEYNIAQHLPGLATVAVELVERGAQIYLVAAMDFGGNTSYGGDMLRSIAEGLRKKLLQSLPTYMVPTLYIPMETMPTNASGKLDRQALR
ncbi:acetyl-CoA synthetase-like protein, partial [Aspergillus indologenus CBS 114.80]